MATILNSGVIGFINTMLKKDMDGIITNMSNPKGWCP